MRKFADCYWKLIRENEYEIKKMEILQDLTTT